MIERIDAGFVPSRKNLSPIGRSFDLLWQAQETDSFDDLLRAIDEADSAIRPIGDIGRSRDRQDRAPA